MIDMRLQYPSRLLGLQTQFTDLQSVLFGVVPQVMSSQTRGHILQQSSQTLDTTEELIGLPLLRSVWPCRIVCVCGVS